MTSVKRIGNRKKKHIVFEFVGEDTSAPWQLELREFYRDDHCPWVTVLSPESPNGHPFTPSNEITGTLRPGDP